MDGTALEVSLVQNEAGIGRRRIFETTLRFGKRVPVYETDGHRVVLRVFDAGFDTRMATLVAKWDGEGRRIDLDGLLVLSFLRENRFIDTLSASDLLQLSRSEARAVLDRLSQTNGLLERKDKRSLPRTIWRRASRRTCSARRPITRCEDWTRSGIRRW